MILTEWLLYRWFLMNLSCATVKKLGFLQRLLFMDIM